MLLPNGTAARTPAPYLSKLISLRVATGYGQPPSTFYDWTLSPSGPNESSFKLPADVEGRLQIEVFSNKVTKFLYSNRLDPVGLASDSERSSFTRYLVRDLEDLEQKLKAHNSGMMELVHSRSSGFDLAIPILML